MGFELRPLAASDAVHCVTVYFAAFQNAHSLACWPRISSVRTWWEQMIHDELHEPGAHWFKAVVSGTEEIAGFVKWVAPKPGVFPDTSLPQWPEGADVNLCNETFGAWAAEHAKVMQDRGHWYLEMVATDPKYQGQGVGTLMIRWGLEKADEQRAEAYLEATPEAVPLYQKLGFVEASHVDTLIENERVQRQLYRNTYMVRPALRP